MAFISKGFLRNVLIGKDLERKSVIGFTMYDIAFFVVVRPAHILWENSLCDLFLIFILKTWKRSHNFRSYCYVQYKQFTRSIHQKSRGINARSFVLLYEDIILVICKKVSKNWNLFISRYFFYKVLQKLFRKCLVWKFNWFLLVSS